MGHISVKMNVGLRDEFGHFIAACDAAATRTVEDLITSGAALSRAMAPVGHKADPRTIPLNQSIESRMISSRSGEWGASARHAMPQEFGAGPHGITGEVSFYWESAGRMWEPGSNEINHPGNAAQPYLRPAYEVTMGRALEVAAEYYP
jgi:hypothetical protein